MVSPHNRVKMEIKHQRDVERRLALGRAEGVADCSAEEAAAWFFEYCSRERLTVHRDDDARLEIRSEVRSRQADWRCFTVRFTTLQLTPYPSFSKKNLK